MDRFKIAVDTSGEGFVGDRNQELARILRQLALDLASDNQLAEGNLYDAQGNDVGGFEFV